ncbi:hypothetical protein GCM10007235_25840 [Pseudoxanthomonas indica]|nr:hypothetical protein GCM10007235_25840 [Pseudoxanthomonas indica]
MRSQGEIAGKAYLVSAPQPDDEVAGIEQLPGPLRVSLLRHFQRISFAGHITCVVQGMRVKDRQVGQGATQGIWPFVRSYPPAISAHALVACQSQQGDAAFLTAIDFDGPYNLVPAAGVCRPGRINPSSPQ